MHNCYIHKQYKWPENLVRLCKIDSIIIVVVVVCFYSHPKKTIDNIRRQNKAKVANMETATKRYTL